jgi:predicted oxidoreductase (fatty acid repression mutant protein)
MLQFALWTSFVAEGLGANLQHYNPLIAEKVAAEWKVPPIWKLNAQLVFGGRTAPADPKTFDLDYYPSYSYASHSSREQ